MFPVCHVLHTLVAAISFWLVDLFDYLFVSSIIATYSLNAVDSAGFGDSGVVPMDSFIAERRSSSSSSLSLFSPSLAVGVAASTLLQSMDRVLIQQLINH